MPLFRRIVTHLPGGHLPITPTGQAFARPWPTTRRGVTLWGLALIFLVQGITFIVSPSPSVNDTLAALAWAPFWVWGGAMVAVSLYSGWVAYCHHGRDRYGFMALSCTSWAFVGAYAGSIVVLDAPGYALSGLVKWALTGWLVWYMAGTPDHSIDGGGRCGR